MRSQVLARALDPAKRRSARLFLLGGAAMLCSTSAVNAETFVWWGFDGISLAGANIVVIPSINSVVDPVEILNVQTGGTINVVKPEDLGLGTSTPIGMKVFASGSVGGTAFPADGIGVSISGGVGLGSPIDTFFEDNSNGPIYANAAGASADYVPFYAESQPAGISAAVSAILRIEDVGEIFTGTGTAVGFAGGTYYLNYSPNDPYEGGTLAGSYSETTVVEKAFGTDYAGTVSVDGIYALTRLVVQSDDDYTFTEMNTSGDSILFDVTGSAKPVLSARGSGLHTFDVPVHAADDFTVLTAPGSEVRLVGDFSVATGSRLTKSGAGRVDLPAFDALGVVVAEGELSVSGSGVSTWHDLAVLSQMPAVSGEVDTPERGELNMSSAGQIILIDHDFSQGVMTLEALTDEGSWLNQIKGGYGSGDWNGVPIDQNGNEAGVIRSDAAADDSALRIGYRDFFGSYSTFTVDGWASILKVTLAGDTDLDGDVDSSDNLTLASNFDQPGVWAGGDFNYDGMVDFLDLLDLAANFNSFLLNGEEVSRLPQSYAEQFHLARSIVPEPSTIGIAIAVLLPSALARFRR